MKAWLAGEGMLEAGASSAEADEAAAWAWKVFAPSWDAVRQSLYTNECVFSDSSTYPVSLAHAWWLAEEKNSLKDWAPEKSDALISTPENTRHLLAEKDNAVAVADEMVAAALQKPAGISTGAHRDIVDRLKISRMYIGGYREIGHALVLTRYLLDHPGDRSEFAGEVRVRLSIALQALISRAEEFAAFAEKTEHRYTTYVLLGHERLRALHADLTRQLGEAAVSLAA
jgi:hypothetical protein